MNLQLLLAGQTIWIVARSTGVASLLALSISLLTGMALRPKTLTWLSTNRALSADTLITIVALFLVLLEGDARQGGLLSSHAGPGSLLVTAVGPFTVAVWGLLIAVIWTVGSGAEYIREAIPLLTRSRPVADAVSGSGEDV